MIVDNLGDEEGLDDATVRFVDADGYLSADGKETNEEAEEGDEEFFEVDRSHVDFVTFEPYYPSSSANRINVPLWSLSVEGFHWAPIRARDLDFLNTLPSPLAEALKAIQDELDPLDMDIPVSIFKPGYCKRFTSFVTGKIKACFRSSRNYYRHEWHRFMEDLDAIRERDIPGYQLKMLDSVLHDQDQPVKQVQVINFLPSIDNLKKLIKLNELANSFGWNASLVRTEKNVPGSILIAFRIQLSHLHGSIHDESVPRENRGSVTSRRVSIEGVFGPDTEEQKRKGKSNSSGLLIPSLVRGQSIASWVKSSTDGDSTPPLLIYQVEGKPSLSIPGIALEQYVVY
jgi:hypothetical protein